MTLEGTHLCINCFLEIKTPIKLKYCPRCNKETEKYLATIH
jgi:NMD protein affecting ribosome stability and mRNA decay